MVRKILFISGAPFNATAGGQRYQQLVVAFNETSEISVPAFFYSPADTQKFTDYQLIGNPYDILNEFNTSADVCVVGYPDEAVVSALTATPTPTVIFDICDNWLGQMIKGVDLTKPTKALIERADAFVAVTPTLLYAMQIFQATAKKPALVAVIENGLRKFSSSAPAKEDKESVVVFFWGSLYTGQEWIDEEALFVLPSLFPHVKFVYFLATDKQQILPRRENLQLFVDVKGVDFDFIVQTVKSFSEETLKIGLIPFTDKLVDVSFTADPIKLKEYLELDMFVLATNVSLPAHPKVLTGFGDARKLLPSMLFLLLSQKNQDKIEGDFKSIPKWSDIAKVYYQFIQSVIRFRSFQQLVGYFAKR